MPDDSAYRREEDKRWRDQVNERLSSLTASEVVQNDRLDTLDETLVELRQLLEGVPGDRNDNGLKGDIREISALVNKLNTVLSLDITGNPGYDMTGKPGYLKKIDMLWKHEERDERRFTMRLRTVLAILGWMSAATVAVIYNADRIAILAAHILHHQTTAVASSGEKHKPKKKRKRPEPPEDDVDAAEEEMPEMR